MCDDGDSRFELRRATGRLVRPYDFVIVRMIYAGIPCAMWRNASGFRTAVL
jgi:hypothetical protein